MNEEKKTENTAEPQAVEQDKIKTEQKDEITVPVKFNKEIKYLTLSEATELAQKGMKFDLITKDLELLKSLASKEGKSISQYLEALKSEKSEKRKTELSEKCSDTELVNKILELENGKAEADLNGFDEVKANFSDIETPEDLPEEVREASRLKGTLLLDEYLRYRLAKKQDAGQQIKTEENARKSSVGSQLNKKAALSPETEEFIKGLWR